MTENTRNELWLVLADAFGEVLRILQETVPSATIQSGQHHNEAFLFWAYAEYGACGRVVVISFNIQAIGERFRIWGDLAREDGIVLKDLMDLTIDARDQERLFARSVKAFAMACRDAAPIIHTELM